jgi:hypothetical protein
MDRTEENEIIKLIIKPNSMQASQNLKPECQFPDVRTHRTRRKRIHKNIVVAGAPGSVKFYDPVKKAKSINHYSNSKN